MQSANIKQLLHQIIDQGDDKFLRILYAVARQYNDHDDFDYKFTEEEIAEFESRQAGLAAGKSKLFSWDEVKAIVTTKEDQK